MDLLAGYGSDADSEQETGSELNHESAPTAPSAPVDPSPAGLLAQLPAPASSKVGRMMAGFRAASFVVFPGNEY